MGKAVVGKAASAIVGVIASIAGTVPAAAGVAGATPRQPGFEAARAISSSYPCGTTFGAVIVPASAWDGQLPPDTGHDGATYNVYSNYRAGRPPNPPGSDCAGDWESADGTNSFGLQYQCTELAVRVADGEWAIGNNSAWESAGWNGAADDMGNIGPKLGLTWTGNGTGSLPLPGDLMVWSSSGGGDPGHVAVVSSVSSSSVTFVGENEGDGMVTLPVSGTTVENDGWKPGSQVLGWLGGKGQAPSPPTVTVAFTSPSKIGLKWTESGAAASYSIVRNGVTVASTTRRSFTDTHLAPGTGYRYVVVATGGGQQASSSTLSTSTPPAYKLEADFAGNGVRDLVYVYPGSSAYIDTFVPTTGGQFTKEVYDIGAGFDAISGTWLTAREGKVWDLFYVVPGSSAYIDTFVPTTGGQFTEESYDIGAGFDATSGTWTTAALGGGTTTDLVYVYPGSTAYIDSFLPGAGGQFTEASYDLGTGFDAAHGSWMTAQVGTSAVLWYVYPGSTAYIDSFVATTGGQFSEHSFDLGTGFDAASGYWIPEPKGKTTDLLYVYPGSTAYVDTFVPASGGQFTRESFDLGTGFDASSGTWMTGKAGTAAVLWYVYPGSTAYVDTFVSTSGGQFTKETYDLGTGFDASGGRLWVAATEGPTTDLFYVYPGSSSYIDTFTPSTGGQFTEGSYGIGTGFDSVGGGWL